MTTQLGKEQEPNPFPDNTFFEDEHGNPRGASWNGEIEGIQATYGVVLPNTSVMHSITTPEIIVTHSGSAHIMSEYDLANEGQSFARDNTLTTDCAKFLPFNQLFRLEITEEEPLVYTCFYPKNSEEMWNKLIKTVIPEVYGVPTCLPSLDCFWNLEMWDGEIFEGTS